MTELENMAPQILAAAEPGPTPTPAESPLWETIINSGIGAVYNPESPSGLHRVINSLSGTPNPPQKRLDAAMPQGPGKGIMPLKWGPRSAYELPSTSQVVIDWGDGVLEVWRKYGRRWAKQGRESQTAILPDAFEEMVRRETASGKIRGVTIHDTGARPPKIDVEKGDVTDASRSHGPGRSRGKTND